MLGWFELSLIALAICLLLYSGYWTDRAYGRFDQIPAHYNIRGEATRLSARRPTAWALPLGFSVLLAGLGAILQFVPDEYINGDRSIALWSMIIGLPAGQVFTLWLLGNWASTQK